MLNVLRTWEKGTGITKKFTVLDNIKTAVKMLLLSYDSLCPAEAEATSWELPIVWEFYCKSTKFTRQIVIGQ